MLELLTRYAEQQDLATEPGFATKTIRWAVHCSAEKGLLGVMDLRNTDDRRSRGRDFRRCPHLSQPELKAAGRGARHFLVDNADVIALLSNQDDPKLLAKHAYFLQLLRQAVATVPEMAIPLRCLEDSAQLQRLREGLLERKAKGTENLTFAVSGLEPLFLVEHESWHSWWREFRAQLAAAREAKKGGSKGKAGPTAMRCLASGELVAPTRTQPKVRGLADVGGLHTGDVLASFKQDSFCSYGLEQAANAAVSEEQAATYAGALNHLLRYSSEKVAKLRVAFWFKERLHEADDNPIAAIVAGAADREAEETAARDRAAKLLRAIHQGKRPDLAGNHYYALLLSGASGRVMLRGFVEGPFPTLLQAVVSWFDDLSMVRSDGEPAPEPKLYALLYSLVRELKDLPDSLEAEIWRAALDPRYPIPASALTLAYSQVRSNILKGETPRAAGMGLLKAYHCRKKPGDSSMQIYLNPDHPSLAYHCGRLIAVLAEVQRRALGDVGAGVVQRYYAAASATPALVLGRLLRTANFHLEKIDKKGTQRALAGRIAEVVQQLGDGPPKTLSLEEQTLFALGYYQQMAHDRAEAKARAAHKKSSNAAGADGAQETKDV